MRRSEVGDMRRILEDYEAKLRSPPGKKGGKGKVEWERYGDGGEELHARFRRLDLPDGATVEIRLDGAILGNATISSGAGRLKFESQKGGVVPKATAGQLAEIVHEGMVLLAGVFDPD
jgi:hypothetical protein